MWDSGHKLLKSINEFKGWQRHYFRTMCASMTAINSRERSTLYSEGCNLVCAPHPHQADRRIGWMFDRSATEFSCKSSSPVFVIVVRN